MRNTDASFGGPWTELKLAILKGYLNAYTTALKNQPFRLVYIDAFAGSGGVELTSVELTSHDEEKLKFIEGSASIAVDVDDKNLSQN